ncbi:VHS1025 protein [Vibrio phage 1]|nr:VHS1025 protein [Vibrio phage 1]
MTPQQQIENRLSTMTADQLFELMRELNAKEDHASIVLLELVTDRYMAVVPDETFLQAMNILEADLI